ncbi:MAG: haloacid dehalogenase-like hydrolase [Planctomycetaceae bacterium]|nr:haloacid dehalogenase-like hydrolase [Planctomycetaceae bacterium]
MYPLAEHVCLFDIDGTLLNSGGAGQWAMEQALEEVFGVTGPYEDIPAAGRTDRAITVDLFAHHGLDYSESNLEPFQAAYFRHLPAALAGRDGRVLPGIYDVIAALHRQEQLELGLLTGNYRIGAELKLKHYQLHEPFTFGAFGDEHLDRDDVARLAYAEACRTLNREVHPQQVWVIGDTPADIRCGRAIGARVIAVATGLYSYPQLAAARPDHLFHDFSKSAELLTLFH